MSQIVDQKARKRRIVLILVHFVTAMVVLDALILWSVVKNPQTPAADPQRTELVKQLVRQAANPSR